MTLIELRDTECVKGVRVVRKVCKGTRFVVANEMGLSEYHSFALHFKKFPILLSVIVLSSLVLVLILALSPLDCFQYIR